LRQAADLLRTSQLSVSEIADRLGFSSGPNFSTLFKERFQVTPGSTGLPQSSHTIKKATHLNKIATHSNLFCGIFFLSFWSNVNMGAEVHATILLHKPG